MITQTVLFLLCLTNLLFCLCARDLNKVLKRMNTRLEDIEGSLHLLIFRKQVGEEKP